jgi:AraC family transcriptional regulator of arabinose operon
MIYTIRGAGDFGRRCAGSRRREGWFVTAPGDAVLIRPGIVHDYRVYVPAGRWHLLWAHFHPRPEWQSWLDWPAVVPAVPGLMRLSISDVGERRTIERALRRMDDLAVGSHVLSMHMAMNALEEVLLRCAKYALQATDRDPRVAQAEEYLCQHLREKIALRDLAEAVGLSVSRLSYLFKKQTGITPQQYCEQHRLERARQLLELTNLPIKAIANELGFENPFYFTLRFKRYAGKSPRKFRRDMLRR